MRTDPVQVAYGAPAFVQPPESPSVLEEHVVRAQAALASLEPGNLAVVDSEAPGLLLGDIGWRLDVPPSLRVADIGYGVHPDSRGRGVARQAIRRMAGWLMAGEDGPGLARVQLDHSVENLASCRAALGAGLEQEGIRRAMLPLRDADAPGGVRRHDVCLHGIVVEQLHDLVHEDLLRP